MKESGSHMAQRRKKQGSGLAVIVIALAIIAMVPRQVWIALVITVVVAFGIYLFVKWQAQKKPRAPIVHEPTLAELTGLMPAPSRRHGSATPAPASANRKILSSMLETAKQPIASSPSQSNLLASERVAEPTAALNRSAPLLPRWRRHRTQLWLQPTGRGTWGPRWRTLPSTARRRQ